VHSSDIASGLQPSQRSPGSSDSWNDSKMLGLLQNGLGTGEDLAHIAGEMHSPYSGPKCGRDSRLDPIQLH
jgi:hypothetical protein